MNNTKAVIAVLAHIALIVFVVFAIWPAIKSTGSDGYNTKTAGVIVTPPVVEALVEETTEVAAEVVETTEAVEVEAVTEQVEEVLTETAVEATPTEMVETAVEEVAVEETPVDVATETVEAVAETAAVEAAEPAAGSGQVHVVTAEGLKFTPLVIQIAPGDTVAWENMSSHDSQAMEGLVPEGAEMWHSAMGENFQQTFTKEGIYVYKCTPHFGAGMGGVIIVGKPVNLEAIKAATVKGAAKRLVKKAIKAAEAM